MLTWILKISIASICFIFLVHHLICFLKNTLTIPKTKDLVNSSSEKYNKMCNILENKSCKEETEHSELSNTNVIDLNNCTSIDSLPTTSNNHMKEELKFFLKNQLNTNNTNNTGDIENYDISESSGKINYSAI